MREQIIFTMDAEERRLELVLLRAVARTRWANTSEHQKAQEGALTALADFHGSLAHLLATLDQSLADDEEMSGQDRELEPRMVWVLRTMRDVRTSDFIRMPGQQGTERVVNAISPVIQHHMHPAGQRYEPKPAEWTEIRITLDGQTYSFDPGMPVEIELEESELVVIESLGWENRIHTFTTSAPNPSSGAS